MAGNALAKLYSWSDGVKRRVSNPLETIALGITRAGEDLGAAATDADIAYGRNGMKSVLLSEQQKAEAAERAAKFGEQMAMAAATVWHGSPHKFDKFDSSKIGTGEGAQAYGHGLYLAESDTVARHYKNAGADPSTFVPVRSIRDPAQMAATVLDRAGGDMRHATAVLTQNMQSGDITAGAALQLLKQRAALPESQYAGHMYKVDLPDDAIAKMLDWDKPLSQQAPEVQKALKIYKGAQWWMLNKSTRGDELVRKIQGKNPQEFASAMKDMGVPGIRYLDGGSRGAGQGSSNFVVFPGNEKLLRILERNGQALP